MLADFGVEFDQDTAARLYNPAEYYLVRASGRFALYHRRNPAAGLTEGPPLKGWSGPVRLRVRLPAYDGPLNDPLISTGSPEAADLVYVSYIAPGKIRIGRDSSLGGADLSDPIDVDYGREHLIDVDLASFHPAGWTGPAVQVKVDGRWAFVSWRPCFPSAPIANVFGYNAFNLSGSLRTFHGSMIKAEAIPPLLSPPTGTASWGAVEMTVLFPRRVAGSEPLLVSGVVRAGDILFVRYLGPDRIQVGEDHWGVGEALGRPLEVAHDRQHSVLVSSAALYPLEGSPEWAGAPASLQSRDCRGIRVWVDGNLALDAPYTAYASKPADVKEGSNAIGASTCDPQFSGIIVQVRRRPVDSPVP